jgi:seryl-tRNA synthetase
MHDIKRIRKNPELFDQLMQKRGIEKASEKILSLDKDRRSGQHSLQELQEQANHYAKMIGQLKSQGENADEAIAKSKELKVQIAEFKKAQEEGADQESNPLTDYLSAIPNTLFSEVPDGKGEEDNEELRIIGEKPAFDFTPKEHWELGEDLKLMDFEQTAKISGSRFVTLHGNLARLERARANFMNDVHTQEFGFEEVSPPILVRDDAMYGSGQLPKFEEDSFATTNHYRLIPTSEVSLVNLVREMILPEEALPLRYVAHTPCFRSEAGSAGRDTRGMLRQHQFWKVELVSITTPESANDEHEFMTGCVETILKRLEIPYRVMLLCSGDTGFCAHKTYDMEAWLPGQNTYREISSCSNCGDFQAHRMKARYRNAQKENHFVHTLNGSGLAVGRTLIAIMENYQESDGSITIPDVLRSYTGFDRINANELTPPAEKSA